MRRHVLATCSSRVLGAMILTLTLSTGVAWGYYFDDRREMSLSGFAYSRATFAASADHIGTGKSLYQTGNLVQHRNFLTLEWRHNINRISREFPTVGPMFQFLNFDAFDYYLNFREAYDGVWDYGPTSIQRQLDGGGGTSFWDKYFGRQTEKYPGQFTRFKNFEYLTSIQFMEKKVNQYELFEWYFNITKGPLFLRIGRQNLSWGETDSFRLLDQINPLDNLFGGFTTSLDERRIPLNMLRAQWSFGTVGPVSDLTLEGFFSPDRRTNAWYVLNQGSFWNVYTNPSPVAVGRMPCGGPYYGRKNPGPNDAPGNGIPCSVRAQGPHSSIEDGRGGARILGTIHDFTFSIAHYYTWQDGATSEAGILSPSAAHLAWDLNPDLFTRLTGKPATPENNPWGTGDQVVGANGVVGGPGGFGVPATIERDLWVPIREKRIQITGASLSFPVNALTGMFVGSDNPLYYIYTTFRGEFAYMRNVLLRSHIHDGAAGTAIQRFLSLPIAQAGAQADFAGQFNQEFLPGGAFSSEGDCTDASGVRGCRRGRAKNRDMWAFSIGLDHNQWIRWLNSTNSVVFSGQMFVQHVLNNRREYDHDRPPGLLNDQFAQGVRPRSAAPIGPGRTDPKLLNRPGGPGNRTQTCILPDGESNPPCTFKGLQDVNDWTLLNTLAISTTYMGGNLTPRFVFFYDWHGAWLMQPGVDWTFWDPFRLQVRYNLIDGNYGGIGVFKVKDSVWFELQYLLY